MNITQDTSIEKQIEFFEGKINQYLNVIKVNPKGETCFLWIKWIDGWNRQVYELRKQLEPK